MDPIYSTGTTVSSYLSFRFSETQSQRRGQTRSESSDSERETNDSATSEESESLETIDSRIEQMVQSLGGSNTGRVTQQAQRIQALFQGTQSQSSSNSPSIFSQSQNQTINSFSYELQSYLQVIRQLMGDEDAYNQFLDQMEAYLTGETGQDQSFTDFLSDLSSQFGISSVQIQQTTSIQFQGQFVVRNGEEVRVIESRLAATEETQQVQSAEPLVFDLDGDGLELTTVQDGVRFDIKGDGQEVQTAFVTGDDAFLALDRNGNGTIDSGKELFGDQHGAANGIEELRKYDDNHDGYIDSNDAVYDQLRLFVDKNGDGVSQKDELLTLEDENITRISLYAKEENQRISGNYMAASTYYERNNGSRNRIGEMYLNYLA